MEDFSQRLAKLSPEKRALLELQLRQNRRPGTGSTSIVRGRRPAALPLSYSQQRVWVHHQLNPDDANHIICIYRMSGCVNLEVLRKALESVVARHEALRTTFAVVEEDPVQVVGSELSVTLRQIDLSALPEPAREVESQRCIDEETAQKFDLTRDCMLRATLVRLPAREHILVLTMHHIASDGWSASLLFHEISELYKSLVLGGAAALPALSIQYADYALWQRQWLQGKPFDDLAAYWRQRLTGSADVLELPTDHPRPAVQSLRGTGHTVVLPPRLAEGLKALSSREGVTLFMTLLSAFKALLFRYTQQEDISVGTFVANRSRVEVESLIGFFINTVVLRTQLSSRMSFHELLHQVRDVTLGAFAHQEMPFEKLLEVLNPKRRLDRTPLFQVAIIHHSEPNCAFALPELTLTAQRRSLTSSHFDLTLGIAEEEGSLKLTFVYCTDLFESETICRLAQHFQILLEAVVSDSEQCISQVSLISESERRELLVTWNQTTEEYPISLCLHQLIDAQVQRTPEAVAVLFAGRRLTYAELNRRANQLAHRLIGLGVGLDVLVGVCLERSVEMIIGILGVLKAGGAYVPLDPAYPTERLAYMLQDARPAVLLTQRRWTQALPSNSCAVICLDEWGTIADEREGNPVSIVGSDHLAYVIYTSGSSGKPKGVLIPHRAVVNHTLSAAKAYAITPADRMLQFASLSFDASAEEIFPALAYGATLVLRTEEMLDTVATCLQRCHDWGLTVLDLPTAYWHEMAHQMETGKLALPESIRLVILGGERALPERLAIWQKLVSPKVRLVNTYGPTEATIVATRWEVPSDKVLPTGEDLPIGQPISNTQVCILDAEGRLVPVGVAGELHIGGVGLARGYLNNPELTAEKFIPNPFRELQTEKLYRSGDRARFRPDGNVEFLGRVDDQVKIRGFRVELGEVEAELRQHASIRECVVVAREETPGDKRLVAYFVAKGTAPLAAELRTFLQRRLPHFLLPATFVPLAALPLSRNGKLDRQALPAPERTEMEGSGVFVAPRNEVEQQVAAVWQAVLKLARVSVHENFFELGGHSLLAGQVISRLRHAFEVDLPMRSLFEQPTIAGLTSHIERLLIDEIQQLSEKEAEELVG